MLNYVENLRGLEEKLGSFIEESAETGHFRVARDIFTDPYLFELEMKYIWEGNWMYLAHETQIPNKNDYFTMYMGRQPIFIARNRNGELNAFINACSHRGAMLCRHKRANKSTYTCPFHGWTFNNSGKLLKVKDPDGAGYPDAFNRDGSHDLTKVPRFESYRGFLFGSLNPDVKPLKEYLGEAAKIIDMIVDQSPEGLEVLRGSSSYIYDGNWKLQTENGADGYHVSAVHWNYAATTSRRKQAEKVDTVRAMDAGGWAKQGGGFYSFEHGHLLLWTTWSNPEDRPNWDRRADLAGQFGHSSTSRSGNTVRSRSIRPRLRSTAWLRRERARRPGHGASVNTKTSLMRPAWRRRTTWRSSAPARSATWAGRRSGMTSPAAPSIGSKGRTRARQRSASIPC